MRRSSSLDVREKIEQNKLDPRQISFETAENIGSLIILLFSFAKSPSLTFFSFVKIYSVDMRSRIASPRNSNLSYDSF